MQLAIMNSYVGCFYPLPIAYCQLPTGFHYFMVHMTYKTRQTIFFWILIFCTLVSVFPNAVYAAGSESLVPSINIGIGSTENPVEVATSLKILFILTVLSLAPAILILMTSFTRIVIVLSFLRQAVGTQGMPPNQILIGLALFLTFFIMSPVLSDVHENALQPYLNEQLSQGDALDKALTPIRTFMFKQTREKDLALFIRTAKLDRPKVYDDIPTRVLIPAFIISELKTAFQIGFMIYIPFLILDMVVASVLLSMGMMMLPPVLISLPFKLMLFVLVDGWHLIMGSLIESFH